MLTVYDHVEVETPAAVGVGTWEAAAVAALWVVCHLWAVATVAVVVAASYPRCHVARGGLGWRALGLGSAVGVGLGSEGRCGVEIVVVTLADVWVGDEVVSRRSYVPAWLPSPSRCRTGQCADPGPDPG